MPARLDDEVYLFRSTRSGTPKPPTTQTLDIRITSVNNLLQLFFEIP